MASKTRHYYKIKVHRFPPFSSVNGNYYHDEYIWAYSREGAENGFYKYHKHGYGDNIPEEFTEITKEEFYAQGLRRIN